MSAAANEPQARIIAWTLGRRVVVLERRGATWRMAARGA